MDVHSHRCIVLAMMSENWYIPSNTSTNMATITPVECRRLAQGEPAHHADCTMTLDQGETLGFAGVVVRMSGGGATTESTLFLNQYTGHYESNVALPPMGTN